MKSSFPKYQEIANSIEASLKESGVAPGSYLPSEVLLAKRYGVTRGTIRRTMEFLEEKGLVSPVVSKRRQFLQVKENKPPIIIGCLAIGKEKKDEFSNICYQRLFDHLVHEFQEKNMILVKILVEPGKTANLPEVAHSEQIKSYLSLENVDISGLSGCKAPIIAINPPYAVTGHYIIRSNGKTNGIDIVRYLHSKGHRKIALLTTETTPTYPFYDDLETGFKRGLELFGLETKESVFNINCNERNNYELCEKCFKKNANAFSEKDALILCTANFANNALRALEAVGISVPNDLSVIAVGGEVDPVTCSITPTVFENDFDAFAKYICEHVINIIDQRMSSISENYINTCRLVEGETVISR